MDNSLLVSLSHQLAAYRSMDVIANNIANASTPGYKRETAKFEEFVTYVRPSETQTGPQALSFVKDAGAVRDLGQGELNSTGATLDLVLPSRVSDTKTLAINVVLSAVADDTPVQSAG